MMKNRKKIGEVKRKNLRNNEEKKQLMRGGKEK